MFPSYFSFRATLGIRRGHLSRFVDSFAESARQIRLKAVVHGFLRFRHVSRSPQ